MHKKPVVACMPHMSYDSLNKEVFINVTGQPQMGPFHCQAQIVQALYDAINKNTFWPKPGAGRKIKQKLADLYFPKSLGDISRQSGIPFIQVSSEWAMLAV